MQLFSKKTLLVAVALAILGVIALFAYHARELGYMDSAIGSLRTLPNAAHAYRLAHPKKGFPLTLQDMSNDGEIDELLGDGLKSGYRYTYLPRISGTDGRIDGYQIHADPADGRRAMHFYVDETGVIRFNERVMANASSPPL